MHIASVGIDLGKTTFHFAHAMRPDGVDYFGYLALDHAALLLVRGWTTDYRVRCPGHREFHLARPRPAAANSVPS